MAQIIKDTRNGMLYKTKYPIDNDKLKMLAWRFVRNGTLTEDEAKSDMRTLDKFPFIQIIGNADGRKKEIRQLPYFTWLICCK